MAWLTSGKSTRPAARPRRALFLMSGLGMGGAELHTLTLRATLEANGWDTTLVGLGRRHSGVLTGRAEAHDAIALGARGMSSLAGWLRLRSVLKAVDPDLVVAVNQAPLIAAVISRLTGATQAPLACVYHTTILRPGDERAQNWFRRALRHADALVYVSARQAAFWRARGLACPREAVILNGVDADRFQPDEAARQSTRAALGLAPDAVVIGSVASLWAEKNHRQLVEALGALVARGIDAHLLLVGDGPLRAALVEQAAAGGFGARLHLAGEVSDVRPWLNAFDIGALASIAVETFSLGALETLASGVPMVMSDVGGAREIVSDGVNGLLVPPGDAQALEGALLRLCDPATRATMAQAARPSALRHTLVGMQGAYRALFDTLVPPC